MAKKVAKYLEVEKEEDKYLSSYSKTVERAAFQKKVTKASCEEIIKMIFSHKLTSTEAFFSGDPNVASWRLIIEHFNRYKNNAKLSNGLKKLEEILLHVSKHSNNFFNEVNNTKILFTITQLDNEFIRPIATWVPKSRNRFKQAFEILRHLFCKYETPEFLDKGFVNGELESISLFMNIGSGVSFKKFELAPEIVLNKKVYHYIFSTPEDYTFFEAFRRAQILSNDGSDSLVRQILGTKLRTLNKKQEEFWFTVIQFFISQPMFDYNHVSQIIDYINFKKYVPTFDNGRTLPPEQPDFSIKGRTIQALLRQSEEWHEHQARTTSVKKVNIKSWKPVAIDNFSVKLTNGDSYEIVQYTSAAELANEGNTMRHCVGSYAHSCATGRTSIWSLRKVTNEYSFNRILTIELSQKNIVQVRGKNNRRAEAFENSIIDIWANRENLSVSKFI